MQLLSSANGSATNHAKKLRVRLVMNDQELTRCAYFEDAIARLTVASLALRTVGESGLAAETDATRERVISQYARFVAGKMEPATLEALGVQQ